MYRGEDCQEHTIRRREKKNALGAMNKKKADETSV